MTWARPLALLVAAALSLTLSAPPAAAEGPRLRTASLNAAAVAKVAGLDASAVVLTQTTPAAASDGRSFFKTKKGAAVAILMAGTLSFAIYSKQHDRIHSKVR